jgi:hypothetical protein
MFEAPSRSVKKAFNVAIIALCVALPTTHLAAQNAGAASDDSNAQLLEKIRQLEAKVDKLEAKLDAQASTPASAPAAATVTPAAQAAPEPAPVADQPQVNEVAERIKLLYFGDVGYERGKYYSANNTFYFGSFDMFATARLSDKVSVIGDLLLTSNADNSIGVDVERLFLKYRQNQYFSATVGRIHTDIGYYNTAFDRGEYFQTPIGRPVMYEFDDQGGFLPMQDLGVSINGEIPSGKLNLKYVFEVTNGRAYGANVEPAQNNVDLNNGKAVNFGL